MFKLDSRYHTAALRDVSLKLNDQLITRGACADAATHNMDKAQDWTYWIPARRVGGIHVSVRDRNGRYRYDQAKL